MTEAFLKKYGGSSFEVESAGLEPGKLNPLAIEAMKEVGINISRNKTKSVFDFLKQVERDDYVFQDLRMGSKNHSGPFYFYYNQLIFNELWRGRL